MTALRWAILCVFIIGLSCAPTFSQEALPAGPKSEQSCPSLPSGSRVVFTNPFEEENLQRIIMRYVSGAVSEGCFPCCFCCNVGTCCDTCKERNKLTTAPSPNN